MTELLNSQQLSAAGRRETGDDLGSPLDTGSYLRQFLSQSSWNLLGKGGLILWVGGLLAITSTLMIGHWVSLPHPPAGNTIAAEFVDNEGVNAFHFLYADCPCSRRTLEHVLERLPVDGVHETVVLVGSEREVASRALTAGYRVLEVTPQELKRRFAVEAAPLLVVTESTGRIVYSGGYTSRKQGLAFQDVLILEAAKDGLVPDELPLFGCAVSKGLKALTDPLSLK